MKCDLKALTGLGVICSINKYQFFSKAYYEHMLTYHVLSIMYTSHDNKKYFLFTYCITGVAQLAM